MFADRSTWLGDNSPFDGHGAAVTPGRRGPAVFVTGCRENRLLCFEDGRVLDRACGIIADSGRQAIAAAAADLDADGTEELYVHNAADGTAHTDMLLDRIDHDGRTVWCDCFGLAVNAERANARAGWSVAAIDRLGTGRYGMLVAGDDAPTRCYELGDDGEITDMADAVGLAFDGGGRSLVSAPLVTDAMDVFVGVEDGPNRLFRNDEGHFSDVAADARGATLIDVGDGGFGLAVGNRGTRNHLYVPHSTGFVDCAPPAFAEPTRVSTVVAADFDNDGRQELFVNVFDGENRLFAPVAEGTTDSESPRWESLALGAAREPRGSGTGAVVVDIDDDGTLELLVVHGGRESQPLSLYDAPTDNGWLRVAPTTQYGAPARGALVTLETDRGRQRRVIDAGSGYLCQGEPVAHFGLGGDTAVARRPERLTVRWPDGRERTLEAPAAETTHTVAHPTAE